MTALDHKPRTRALTREEFERFSPMVRRQAMWISRRGPRSLSVPDLVAAGFNGVIDALATSSSTDQAELIEYAQHRIKAAMLQHIEALDPHLAETRSLSRAIARAIAVITRTLGRSPASHEIAEALAMTDDEYASSLLSILRAGLARIEVISLDRSMQERMDDDDDAPSPDLADAIEALPSASQEILTLVYQENCSIAEAAAVLGTTPRNVEIALSETMHRVRALTGRE